MLITFNLCTERSKRSKRSKTSMKPFLVLKKNTAGRLTLQQIEEIEQSV